MNDIERTMIAVEASIEQMKREPHRIEPSVPETLELIMDVVRDLRMRVSILERVDQEGL